MSYFTDDEPYKSTVAPLVVDNNNLPSEKLGLLDQNIQNFLNEAATGTGASETKNIAAQLNERQTFLEEELGPDYENRLKDYGYERGVMGPAGDPWLSTGRSEGYETALEAYRETLSGDKKARLLVGDEIERAAKERAKRVHDETSKKLERTKYGWWAGLPGAIAAHLTDPFEVFTLTLAPAATPSRLIAAAGRAGLAGRVGLRAGVEMGAGFAYEAPAQFGQIKPYKNELGIPYTNRDAANAVFAATIFSGVFGGVFEFGAAAFRKVKTGEWTPEQAQKHIAENYNKLPPEEQEMADIALGLMERERLNPYGPTEEGRKKFNKEFAEAEQHAHSTGRRVTEEDVIKAQELAEPRDLDQELAELREAAIRDAGLEQQADELVNDIEAPDTPTAPLDQFEPVLRALSDNYELGDEISGGALSGVGLDPGRIEEFIEYARQQGYLKSEGESNTLAKSVTGKSDVLPDDAELPAPLKAIADRIIPENVKVKMADKIGGEGTRFQTAPPVDSPEFKKWSGGSPLVRSNEAAGYDFKTGEPVTIEVFHGTKKKYDELELQKGYGSNTKLLWLSPDRGKASRYALTDMVTGDDGTNSQVYDLYLSLKNPYVFRPKKKKMPLNMHEEYFNEDIVRAMEKRIAQQQGLDMTADEQATFRQIVKDSLEARELFDSHAYAGIDEMSAEIGAVFDALYSKNKDLYRAIVDILYNDKNFWHGAMFDDVKQKGHDGIIFKEMNDFDGQQDQYVVFDKKRIKSIHNRGTFDPDDPRIMYQADGSKIQGAYFPEEKIIQISRAALDPEGTARHEAMEALYDLGYFQKEEWDMLEASAIEGDWISKHNIEQRYKDIYDGESQRGDMLREAINEEYAAWARGETQVTPALEKLFERVKQILNDVAKILRQQGINDYRDIFKMVESGELKKRGGELSLKTESEPQPLIDIDGVQMTPEELIRAADNDLAMAENIALCAKLGG